MGCTCNKQNTEAASSVKEHEPHESKSASSRVCHSLYNHSQISTDLEDIKIDRVSYVDLIDKPTSNGYTPGVFSAVTKITTKTGPRVLIAFKRQKEYATVASVLALLSHKDPSTLTTINPNSVNDTPKLQIPSNILNQ